MTANQRHCLDRVSCTTTIDLPIKHKSHQSVPITPSPYINQGLPAVFLSPFIILFPPQATTIYVFVVVFDRSNFRLAVLSGISGSDLKVFTVDWILRGFQIVA